MTHHAFTAMRRNRPPQIAMRWASAVLAFDLHRLRRMRVGDEMRQLRLTIIWVTVAGAAALPGGCSLIAPFEGYDFDLDDAGARASDAGPDARIADGGADTGCAGCDAGPPVDAGPDESPPSIEALSPSAGASHVDPVVFVEATFDEPLEPATVDGSSFIVSDALGPIAGTVSYDAATRTARFEPDDRLALLREVTAVLTTRIADPSGNALAAEQRWTFTTREGTWGTPTRIATKEIVTTSTAVTMTESGGVIALWTDGTPLSLWAAEYQPDSGWGPAMLIEENDADDVAGLLARTDATGRSIAIWSQEDDTGASSIFVNHHRTDSGWGGAYALARPDGSNDYFPDAALDPAGGVNVVWRRGSAAQTSIFWSRYVPGGGWTRAELVEDTSLSSDLPRVALAGDGTIFAVWERGGSIVSSRRLSVDDWSVPDVLGAGGLMPAVSTAGGNPVAIWWSANDIWASRWNGSDWTASESIGVGAIAVSSVGSIQILPSSPTGALAVWDGSSTVYGNRIDAGAWPAGVAIAPIADRPRLTTDHAGNGVVVFSDHNTDPTSLGGARFRPDTGWSVVERVSPDDGLAIGAVSLAGNSSGYATAIYVAYDQSTLEPDGMFAIRLE